MRNKHAEKTTEKLVKLLKEKRLAKGLSHQTLADIAGVNRSTISRIESGERIPTITVCLKIASALDYQLNILLKEIEN
jgi:transcriptional regulator with XRE-family HTH domain